MATQIHQVGLPVTPNNNSYKLVGYNNFVRVNPRSDRFTVNRVHHLEFWCGDSTSLSRRLSWGLGVPIVAKSDLSTGNQVHASYLLHSHHLSFLFTSSYSPQLPYLSFTSPSPSLPSFSHSSFNSFLSTHSLGVRALALEVDDAVLAYNVSMENGAIGVSEPIELGNGVVLAEVKFCGDVVLRYVSYGKDKENDGSGKDPSEWTFLPGFEKVTEEPSFPGFESTGIRSIDHITFNTPDIGPVVNYVRKFTGFHDFAEFTAEDIGTKESGLNSVTLTNNEESILIPINEPVFGTKRRSQAQTFLEHNEGAGIQHVALITDDIFKTLREMRKRSSLGGLEFMPPPPPTYYKDMRNRVGDVLTEEQMKECEELGIMVDKDDEGTLLQIFTKHFGHRPTIFIEIMQRVGCMMKDDKGNTYQKPACGGFGKGNISYLFKSLEEYEKTLNEPTIIVGDDSP